MKIDSIVTALAALEKALDAAGLSHHVAIAIDQPRWREFVGDASRYLRASDKQIEGTPDSVTVRSVTFYCWRGGSDPIERQIQHLRDLQRTLERIRRGEQP